MKIANSAVSMAAATSFTQKTTKSENLTYWVGNRSQGLTRLEPGRDPVKLDISRMAKQLSRDMELAAREQGVGAAEDGAAAQADGLTDKDSQLIRMLDAFFYRLTGKHIKFRTLDQASMSKIKAVSIRLDSSGELPVQRAGFGLIYNSSESYSESASLSYKAAGMVKTEDGRTIGFNVALNMSREFQSSSSVSIRAGDAKVDPLVINLKGAPKLSGRDFSFDIDNDGESEQVSKLLTGSGFLALDKNEDGQINNGGELFGPTVGNGFEELKTYDSDGNGWIDENDPVYDKLRIWMADESGDMKLFALGQQGVGAIYLGNVASEYDVKDAGNNTLGTIQSTGVFLKENGGAGTVQHIDLTV